MVVLIMAVKPGIYIIDDAEEFIKLMEDMQKAYLNETAADGGAVSG